MTVKNGYEICLMPVYAKDLPAMWSHLAELNPIHGTQSASDGVLDDIETTVKGFAWRKAFLRELAGAAKPVQSAFITCIAEAALNGSAATFAQLKEAGASATNEPFTYGRVKGNLAWITKYAVKITGKPVWPFEFVDQGADKPTGERYLYRMPKTLAEWWLEIVSAR